MQPTSMRRLEQALDLVNANIEKGCERILRQYDLIREIDSRGGNSRMARVLLRGFWISHVLHVEDQALFLDMYRQACAATTVASAAARHRQKQEAPERYLVVS